MKIIRITLIISIVTILMSFSSFADDTAHWSDKVVDKWSNLGYIELDQSGEFNPDKGITRKEFVRMVNKTFGYKEISALGFKDVEKNNPYYLDILISREAGYISGYEDNTFRPDGSLTRAEVSTIISRILKLEIPEGDMYISNFSDYGDIQDWSKGYISSVVRKGYLKGYEDNTVKANKEMTKAEALTLLDNVTGVILNKPGSYALGQVDGNITINTSDVVLKSTNLKGDIILASGIGEGDASLEGVKLNGTLFVNGGGENSIHLKDSDIYGVNVAKKNGKVRIVAEGNTKVLKVEANSGAKFESEKSSFGEIKVNGKKNHKVILEGNFDKVKTEGSKVQLVGKTQVNQIETLGEKNEISLEKDSLIVELKANSDVSLDSKGKVEKLEASKVNQKLDIKGNVNELKVYKKSEVSLVGSEIGKVIIGEKSEGTNLVSDKTTKIKDMEVSSEASILGQGKVEKATVNSDGVKIEQKVDNIKKGKNVVSIKVNGKEITKSVSKDSTKASTSGKSSKSSNSSSKKKHHSGGGSSSSGGNKPKPTPDPKPDPKPDPDEEDQEYTFELEDTFAVGSLTKDIKIYDEKENMVKGFEVYLDNSCMECKDENNDGTVSIIKRLLKNEEEIQIYKNGKNILRISEREGRWDYE